VSVERDTVTVLVRFFAAARAAAGLDEEKVAVPAPASVETVAQKLRSLHPDGLPRILDAAGFLLDGVAIRDRSHTVRDGAELDILPPFAGG
jgi:molybdopterin synthase sulfur carrier subunit